MAKFDDVVAKYQRLVDDGVANLGDQRVNIRLDYRGAAAELAEYEVRIDAVRITQIERATQLRMRRSLLADVANSPSFGEWVDNSFPGNPPTQRSGQLLAEVLLTSMWTKDLEASSAPRDERATKRAEQLIQRFAVVYELNQAANGLQEKAGNAGLPDDKAVARATSRVIKSMGLPSNNIHLSKQMELILLGSARVELASQQYQESLVTKEQPEFDVEAAELQVMYLEQGLSEVLDSVRRGVDFEPPFMGF